MSSTAPPDELNSRQPRFNAVVIALARRGSPQPRSNAVVVRPKAEHVGRAAPRRVHVGGIKA